MIEASEFVVLKLTTGEQLLAAVTAEFDESVVIAFPLVLKSIPSMKDGIIYERLATAEYCSFTDEKEFNIYRKDIVYIKPMKKAVAVMYQRSLQEMYIMSSESSLQIEPEQEVQQETQQEDQQETVDKSTIVYH